MSEPKNTFIINDVINDLLDAEKSLVNPLMKLNYFGRLTKNSELIEIIDTEEPNAENKTFGEKVNGWIVKMVNKALDGSWNVGIGAAGSLLAEAIWKYYGF